MILSYLNIGIGAAAGAVLSVLAANAYFQWKVIPEVKQETRLIAEAEARKRTEAAINEVQDVAERARAMRRYCRDNGMQYNFVTGECR